MADLLSAISVLLVFLTILLNSIEKEVNEILKTRKPPIVQEERRKAINHSLLRVLLFKSLPITLTYFIIAYSLLPQAVHIILSSRFSFWQFDSLNTIFVFIELGFWGLTTYSAVKSFLLIKKWAD